MQYKIRRRHIHEKEQDAQAGLPASEFFCEYSFCVLTKFIKRHVTASSEGKRKI